MKGLLGVFSSITGWVLLFLLMDFSGGQGAIILLFFCPLIVVAWTLGMTIGYESSKRENKTILAKIGYFVGLLGFVFLFFDWLLSTFGFNGFGFF